MAGSGSVAFPSVPGVEIGGVSVKRHPLTIEAGRLNAVAQRIGKRLIRWCLQTQGHEVELERVVGRDPETGVDIREPVLRDGKPVLVPLLPDEDFRESWKLYQRTVSDLLVEQRERAKLGAKNPQTWDDATFDARLAALAKQAVLAMPADELRDLLKQRALDIEATARAAPVVDTSASDSQSDTGDLIKGFRDE